MCVRCVLVHVYCDYYYTAQHSRESFKHRCRAYIPIRPAEIFPAIDSFTVFQYVHIMVMKALLLCVCVCACVCVCVCVCVCEWVCACVCVCLMCYDTCLL